MKDLKKKTEELRKQKAESLMPKKQAEKAPEKPKEEVEWTKNMRDLLEY